MYGSDPFARVAYPFLPCLLEVGYEIDRHQRVAASRDIEDVNVSAELIGDLAVRERRAEYVETGVMRELLEIASVHVHRPQIHRAVAIAGEVNSVAPDQRSTARSRPVRGEPNRGIAAFGELPDIRRRAALIPFGIASLFRKPGEVKRTRLRIDCTIAGLRERQRRNGIRAGIDLS